MPAALRGLTLVSRWNRARLALSRWEVSLLEGVRIYDAHADDRNGEDPWECLYARYARGCEVPPGEGFARDRFLFAAGREKLGPDFLRRCEWLAEAIETGLAAAPSN